MVLTEAENKMMEKMKNDDQHERERLLRADLIKIERERERGPVRLERGERISLVNRSFALQVYKLN